MVDTIGGKERKVSQDPLLVDLAEQVLENWNSGEMERRRKLWEAHFRHGKQYKIPVRCAVYDYYNAVWQKLIPEERIVNKEGIERSIEIVLRIKLEKFRRFHDDDVIWPTIGGVVDRKRRADSLWGVPLMMETTDIKGGSYRPIPPIKGEKDLELITIPEFIPMKEEETRLIEEMSLLTDGRLPVKIGCDEIRNGPYEWAVRMRGAENLLYDVYDRPEWVHRLMDKITEGIIAYNRSREKYGMIDFEVERPRHNVPYDTTSPESAHKLSGVWTFQHAQSSASLSPAMYEEFIQPYHDRLGRLFGKIYYHGCENLGQKAECILKTPNLKYFHVSPWTKVEDVVEKLGDREIVLEVHSHPSNVLFCWDREQMREEIKRRIKGAQGQVFDLKICDIETIEGAEGKLESWTEVAMEESVKY